MAKPRQPKARPGRAARKPARPKRPARTTERSADVRLVERTLDLLADHDRAVAASKRAIGAHVLAEYFDDDADLARSRNAHKAKSYALLAERAEIETSWNERDLRDAVNIELCARSLPSELQARLEPTYLLRLLSIDALDARVRVAARIASGEVRGQAAKDLIAEHAADRTRGGRPRQPAAVRTVAALERALERAEGEDAFDARELAKIELPDQRRALERRLRDVIDVLTRAVDRLRS